MKTLALALASAALVAGAIVQSPVLAQAVEVPAREPDVIFVPTVITLYLLPRLNEKLMPTLKQLKPGTRIVSHSFLMGDWMPEKSQDVNGRMIYFWTVPG